MSGVSNGGDVSSTPSVPRCGNTIHSNYVSDHRCQRERGHDGDCLFGSADSLRGGSHPIWRCGTCGRIYRLVAAVGARCQECERQATDEEINRSFDAYR